MAEIAVLTGDIIGSTRLAPEALEGAMRALGDAAHEIAGWAGTATRFTRARGDGWQMVLTEPRLSLRAALFLRASLRRTGKGMATRVSVAHGAGTIPETGDLNGANGAAFVLSGRGLDQMARGHELALAGDMPGAAAAVGILADVQSRRWSVAQARVLALLFAPDAASQTEVAQGLGMSRQAVAKLGAFRGQGAMLAAIEAWETWWE